MGGVGLGGLHILLTYQCLQECDHCFLFCGPRASGTFTRADLRDAIRQAADAGVEWLYLEGGEPFLFYPLLLEALHQARGAGLRCGVVTNGYWATSEEDAALWLQPLLDLGVEDLSVSEDLFHCEDPDRSPARTAYQTAQRLGLPVGRICIEHPLPARGDARRGAPVMGGEVSFRGRAVERLLDGIPRRPYTSFAECPDEDLARPARVHLDPYGHVFVCQGLSIGNVRERPVREIWRAYRPADHPIVGPLLRGGPAELARVYGRPDGEDYASACHLCYSIRRGLIDRFPLQLCPRQVYGRGAEGTRSS